MGNFIEITDINDNKKIINKNNIICIEECFDLLTGGFRFTQFVLQGEQYPKTYERLAAIKERLNNDK